MRRPLRGWRAGGAGRPATHAPQETRPRGGALHCSFCGKHEDDVSALLAGIERFICDRCVAKACADLGARGISEHVGEAPPHYCGFCGKHEGDVARMIAGPPSVNICCECVALCQRIVSERAVDQQEDTAVAEKDAAAGDSPDFYCSFCGEPRTQDRPLIAGPAVFICRDCVKICVDLCAGRGTPGTDPPDGG